MRNFVFSDGDNVLVQVSKTTAKKLFERDENVCFCPSKLSPVSMFYHGSRFKKSDLIEKYGKEEFKFENLLNAFVYYNCTPETGRYVTFYHVQERR